MGTIRAIANVLPQGRLDHQQLVERFGEKEMRSVHKMTGINQRRIALPGQCASDLAFEAAERLIAHHQIDRTSIDALIFTSQTPDYRTPATACALHGRLGLSERCAAFDINQACAGYVYSLMVGNSLLASGAARRVMLLNGDTLSKMVHPDDRGLVALTGDAGVATLLEAGDGAGIEAFRLGTDGSQFQRLIVPAGGCRSLAPQPEGAPPPDFLFMDGPAVFHFSIYRIPDFLRECLGEWQMTMDDIDLVLLHQANRTMVEMIYKSLRVPPEKQFINIGEIGNTAGAALPTLLSEAWREGRIKPGSRTLLCGFGAGLSWGALTIRWPDSTDPATPGDPQSAWDGSAAS